MSARGARSRKAVAKDIEKKEKKQAYKEKAVESVRRPHDAFVDWRHTPSLGPSNNATVPSRSITISSDASRNTSRSSSTGQSQSRARMNAVRSNDSAEYRPMQRTATSASGSASISEGSTTGKEKSKYQKGGKETKAPRGRGGGVPIKRPTVTTPLPPLFHPDVADTYISPHQKTWRNFRIWQGGNSGFPPYGGFEFDEDMQKGNVLIYFKEEQISEDRPIPQLRCDLETLESSGSTWLSNALLYGRIDDNEDDWAYAPESSSAGNGYASPNFPQPPNQRRMLGPTALGGRSPPPFDIDQPFFGVPSSGASSRAQYYSDMDSPGGHRSPPPFQQTREIQPTHELWFTAPAHVRTPQGQRLHHVAIRNFLAMLHDKPIVGADLFDMLSTLQPEIQVMFDLDSDDQSRSPRERSVHMITNYLRQHKLDDMRNDIKTALSILAWAEQDNVKWREGYIESFVHLAGVVSPEIEDLADYRRLSIVTRRNLGIAAKSLQLRVMEAEEKLSAFDFAELWSENIKAPSSPVYQSYAAFRQFLANHYTNIYGNWPPSQNNKIWLNRKVVLSLQEDFGALYDYLVNRDVVWDSREERPGKKWEMLNKTSDDFRADNAELSLTDMLVTFDNRHGYLHIPHPYPLLPREVPQVKPAQKKSLFSGLKKTKTDVTKDAKAHLQLSIVFSDATNIEKTDVSFNGTTLIDKFERFELGADLKNVTPREARLGRWILLYGILQVLSTLSVDVRDLRWTDSVRYFLCTDLKRCPDWATGGQTEYLEASQLRSYCWQRPWGPTTLVGVPFELEGNSLPVGSELAVDRRSARETVVGSQDDVTLLNNDSQRTDSATRLNNDIRRIGEKIEHISIQGRRDYDQRRIENEKIKQEEFDMTKRRDDGRLNDEHRFMSINDFEHRPLVPSRSPMRSPLRGPESPGAQSPQDARAQIYGSRGRDLYYNEERGGWM